MTPVLAVTMPMQAAEYGLPPSHSIWSLDNEAGIITGAHVHTMPIAYK